MEDQAQSEALDPRIRRTRQMLHDSLHLLLQSESIEKISVADIAEKATLNRATFYDHYPDKFALFEGMVSSRFQEVLDRRQVVYNGSCPAALMSLILAMCDYLEGMPGIDCQSRRQMERYFESALTAVVHRTLLMGLKHHHPMRKKLAPELIAAVIGGAIYSGAREWVKTPGRVPADKIAKSIFQLISPLLNAA